MRAVKSVKQAGDTAELWRLSAVELGQGYCAGSFDPVDVLHSMHQRIDAVNGRLNALIAVNEQALAEAEQSRQRWRMGCPLSPLDGVPFTVKDNIPARGLPCTWGSRLYADYVPLHDELPVRRLRDAGMVLLGKTNVPEFTLQGYTDNLLFGATRNPWNPDLTPGGSSGGAVSCVAAGIGPVALCTDGGGSIRRPASHTNLVGLKPSAGLVARAGGLPEILPGMEVIGPVSRTVADSALVMSIIAQPDAGVWMDVGDGVKFSAATWNYLLHDRPGRPIRRRIAYLPALQDDPVDSTIAASVAGAAKAFEGMGHYVATSLAPAVIGEFNRRAWPAISQAGLAGVLGPEVDLELLTPAMREMLSAGRELSAVELFKAEDVARRLRATLNDWFQGFDFLLLPSAAALPWSARESHPGVIHGKPVGPRGHAVFTAFVNAAGLPAINLPARRAPNGLPIGFQLVGPRWSDQALCRLAMDYEKLHPWHEARPDLD